MRSCSRFGAASRRCACWAILPERGAAAAKGCWGFVVAKGLCAWLVVALTAHALWAQSEEAVPDPALDAAFQKLVVLELGQDLGAFAPIQRAVARSHVDQRVRVDLEKRLTAVLRGPATDLALDYACRELALVGSDESVSVLVPLLSNVRLSYMARYALEGIGGAAAGKALRDMLANVEGPRRVGIVTSLGRLADREAVPAIAALLAGEDWELTEAALVALGRIGDKAAGEALKQFVPAAPEVARNAAADAALEAAASLARQGERNAAADLYALLQSADAEHFRAAAYRGLIELNPPESARTIAAGLASEEPWRRVVAADCLCDVKDSSAIGTIAAAIPDLPEAGQTAAYASLKRVSHAAIRAAAWRSLQQPAEGVRVAALEALAASAVAEDVPRLAELTVSANRPAERDAAFETLRTMPAEGTDLALLDLLNRAADLPPALVRCAFARRSPVFVPAFLQAAESANAQTRLVAFNALEIMATEKEADSLIRLLCKTPAGEEREAADRAVWMSCQRIAEPALRTAPLLAAMARADEAGQSALLPSLARMGGEEALAAVRAAMRSQNAEVRDSGYRALANWPDASVADELLEIAKSSDVPAHRVWSLRAYVRLMSLPSQRPPQETFGLLKQALELATRAEDKALIVTRMGAVRSPDCLTLLLTFLDDAELKTAAIPAIFELAKGLSQSDPEPARAALEKIQSRTDDPVLRQRIPRVLRDMELRRQAGKQ